MVKKIFDLSISLLLVIVILPLLFIISFVIKLDSSGPVFFCQKRLGKDGKVFSIYKFRTMIDNAEKQGTGLFTRYGDPRITRVGSLLRKTSLDELPQLFNVLKGEMSLVGPRPPTPHHPYSYNEYTKEQKKRFKVRPGITGYAQVKGRNSLSWDERIEYDVYYVDNQSFFLDMKIIIMTMFVIANKKQIYNLENKQSQYGSKKL